MTHKLMYQAQTQFSSFITLNGVSGSNLFLARGQVVPIFCWSTFAACRGLGWAHWFLVVAWCWCRQRFPETTQVTVNNTRLGLVARAVNEPSQSFPLMGKTPTRAFLLLKKANTSTGYDFWVGIPISQCLYKSFLKFWKCFQQGVGPAVKVREGSLTALVAGGWQREDCSERLEWWCEQEPELWCLNFQLHHREKLHSRWSHENASPWLF